jgi:hypothetical protein
MADNATRRESNAGWVSARKTQFTKKSKRFGIFGEKRAASEQ